MRKNHKVRKVVDMTIHMLRNMVERVRRQQIWHKSRRRFVESDPRLGLMLSGELAVLQAPLFDGLSLDPFALFDGGLGLAEVGIGGRHVVQALVVTLVVVVLDEGLDPGLKVAGHEVVLQHEEDQDLIQ